MPEKVCMMMVYWCKYVSCCNEAYLLRAAPRDTSTAQYSSTIWFHDGDVMGSSLRNRPRLPSSLFDAVTLPMPVARREVNHFTVLGVRLRHTPLYQTWDRNGKAEQRSSK